MNYLSIGDQWPIFDQIPERALILDEGPLIDTLTFPDHYQVTRFDPARDHFNILKDINHAKARELASVFYAAEEGGANTLTVRNGKRALAKLLLGADRLDRIAGDRKDLAVAEALGMIDGVLFSPVVKDILCGPTNMSFKGTILARLNRAELGDEDCLILGLLLIAMYPGPVVVTDFGFYGRKHHIRLIRQNRLIAAIRSFAEIPDGLRQELLLIDDKVPSRTTFEDAELLAPYLCPFLPGTDGYGTFIKACIATRVRASDRGLTNNGGGVSLRLGE